MKTIDSFFKAYKKGAFLNNPTEALRAIRSIKEYRHISSSKLKETAPISSIQAPNDAIDIILNLVVDILDDMRDENDNIIKLSVMLREILGPIDCYLTNIESNNEDKHTKRHKVYISSGVLSSLKVGVKPDVVFEHKIPIKVLREDLFTQCFNKAEVFDYLKNNLRTVFITKDEDRKLLKFKDSIPNSGDRYEETEISILSTPVYFRRGHSSMRFIEKYA